MASLMVTFAVVMVMMMVKMVGELRMMMVVKGDKVVDNDAYK